jgi:hypothetical protein
MHQEAANRMRSQATRLVAAAVDAFGYADRFGFLSLITELRGVVQHEDRSIGRRHPVARCPEMTGQDVCLADPIVGEKATGRLGIGPILADQRNALPHGAPDLRQQFAQSFDQTVIGKTTAAKLTINPRLNCSIHRHRSFAIRCPTRNHDRFLSCNSLCAPQRGRQNVGN